tara:strand:+ start:330 stop:842 length:513 start_codon:yes stop_codon:yes gene_type:complete
MKSFTLKIFILIFFLFNSNFLYASEKLAFIDLDKVLKKSIFGKSLLIEIDNINKKNIQNLKNKEVELKKNEEEINKKKNILSEEEFKKEVNILKEKIIKFREQKNKMVASFEKKKTDYLNDFFSKISPIIQNYMDQNSIDILLERKNVFIGKSNSDITDIIIENINKKFN